MFRAVIAAFTFLTRIPLAIPVSEPDPQAAERGPSPKRDLGRAVGFFPLVGLVLGGVGAGLAFVLVGVLPVPLIAVLLVATLAALTGGLHLDGLADLFDGLGGGGGDRERTLAIMRDSRIGAHGATALVLLLVAKIFAVTALIDQRAFSALIAFPLLARWAVVPQIVLFRDARPDGLGHAFHVQAGRRDLLLSTVITIAFVAVLGRARIREAGAVIALSLLMGWWLRRRLGGLTGDTYGATIELCETAALFAATLR